MRTSGLLIAAGGLTLITGMGAGGFFLFRKLDNEEREVRELRLQMAEVLKRSESAGSSQAMSLPPASLPGPGNTRLMIPRLVDDEATRLAALQLSAPQLLGLIDEQGKLSPEVWAVLNDIDQRAVALGERNQLSAGDVGELRRMMVDCSVMGMVSRSQPRDPGVPQWDERQEVRLRQTIGDAIATRFGDKVGSDAKKELEQLDRPRVHMRVIEHTAPPLPPSVAMSPPPRPAPPVSMNLPNTARDPKAPVPGPPPPMPPANPAGAETKTKGTTKDKKQAL